jgi:GDP-mannose 6-dehydrogenase
VLDAVLDSNDVLVKRALEAVLATEKRRAALLGLAFKPGTDDLRESPLVELAERLLGKGRELAIHDTEVSLGKLHGSNRAYLEDKLPHVSRLMREDVDAAVADAEVVVVGHALPLYDRDEIWRAQGKVVLRLT